jgi:outer membrane lipoprotein-sorting protein
MRRRPAIAALLWVVVSAASAGLAAGPPDATADLFRRLEKAAAGVTTVASDFIQEKHLAMFHQAIRSRGRFRFRKPDSLRWEYTEPVASGFVLNGTRGRRWHERTGSDERFDVRRDPVMKIVSEQILAWAKPDFDWLRREYRIRVLSDSPPTLRLEPQAPPGAGTPDHLRIVFSPDGRSVRTVEIHDRDGDFTVIRFVDTVVNGPIAPDQFE